MKCLYCDNEIKDYSLYSLLFEEDKLCLKCRNKMNFHHQKFKLEELEVESFYEYESLFKDLLLQYKECYDEALYEIFLYKIYDYIKLKYIGYKILYVPSSTSKLSQRGFNHIKKIYESLNFEEINGLEMIEDISQVTKSYKQRSRMKTNYKYTGKSLNKVLIVDDVCTSGSSLMGVYDAIKDSCKVCKAIVLAKT